MNRHPEPNRNFLMLASDVIDHVLRWMHDHPQINASSQYTLEIMLWHTHPSGLVGPSQEDVDQRSGLPDVPHLVITLPNGEGSFY